MSWSRVSKGSCESRVQSGQFGQGLWPPGGRWVLSKAVGSPRGFRQGGDVLCHLKTVGFGTRSLPLLSVISSSSIN